MKNTPLRPQEERKTGHHFGKNGEKRKKWRKKKRLKIKGKLMSNGETEVERGSIGWKGKRKAKKAKIKPKGVREEWILALSWEGRKTSLDGRRIHNGFWTDTETQALATFNSLFRVSNQRGSSSCRYFIQCCRSRPFWYGSGSCFFTLIRIRILLFDFKRISDPTVWSRSGSLLFQRGNVPKTVPYISPGGTANFFSSPLIANPLMYFGVR